MPLTLNGTTGVQDNSGAFVAGTAQASTSGTAINFGSIPSWVKRVTVLFNGVSTNGASIVQVQIGSSGGIETTGYASSGATNGTSLANFATGYPAAVGGAAAYLLSGPMTITNISGNTWIMGATIGTTTFASVVGGTKTISGALTQVRITTVNGTDAFDAGSINILYE
jgi:hypothetical protein